MNNDLGSKCRQMFEMSLQNLQGGTYDLADEVIVSLWVVLEKQFEYNEELRRELSEYSTNEQQKRLTEYYQQIAILETRLAAVTKERDELKARMGGLEK